MTTWNDVVTAGGGGVCYFLSDFWNQVELLNPSSKLAFSRPKSDPVDDPPSYF
jgi:hypothetical protein